MKKEEVEKVKLPIIDVKIEKIVNERAKAIKETNETIRKLINSLFKDLYYTFDDKGDNRIVLMEIPFNAVLFHDLKDKNAYEQNTFVNFDVLGVHKIKVLYVEGRSGSGYSAFACLKIQFLWNQLQESKVQKGGISSPYYSSFADEELTFAENFVFQTEEQYLLFKEIYYNLKLTAKELGVDF